MLNAQSIHSTLVPHTNSGILASGAAQLHQCGLSSPHVRSYSNHEHLYMAGDPHTQVYEILEGVVGLYDLLSDGRRQIVTFYYPGDYIGVDYTTTCQHNAEALSSLMVRTIPARELIRLMTEDPEFGKSLMMVLTEELTELRHQMLSLGRKSALERLATFLARISKKSAARNAGRVELYLPMTRAEIGDYLGLTIETVSRNFTKLKVASIIRIVSKDIVEVIDQDLLNAVADGKCH